MSERRRTWPALVVRGIALWILAGAAFKLLLGSPSDLPRFLRDLPLDVRWTYRLLIVVEAFVALFALARPRRAWPLVALLLVAFVGGLVVQMVEKAPSCGCFGSKLPIPPAVMLGIDLALLVLLLLAAPWRLPPTSLGPDLGFAAVAVVLAVVATAALDREGRSVGPGKGWARLPVDEWVGKTLAETELARWMDVSQGVDGQWFLYSETCEVCAECLFRFTRGDRMEGLELTLVRLSKELGPDEKAVVHDPPEGPDVHHFALPTTMHWDVTPPAELVVEEGRVVRARSGFGPEECKK
jgi:hypothetical protein